MNNKLIFLIAACKFSLHGHVEEEASLFSTCITLLNFFFAYHFSWFMRKCSECFLKSIPLHIIRVKIYLLKIR